MTALTVTRVLPVTLDQVLNASRPVQQDSQVLAEKFQSLMRGATMSAPAVAGDDGTAVASRLVSTQDAELQHTVDDVLQLSGQAPAMSMNEVCAGTMRVTLELASTQLDLEAKMGVVDSSKSAIETLMKNQ
jgi:type III secretion inner rod protein HrpB2